jgi:hypothetical protein
VSIAFYCTGRGAHDRIPLPAVTTRNYGRSITITEPCPACGLGSKTLGWRIRQQLAAETDVSALPF